MKFIRKITKKENQASNSKDAAKERLHLVLMQDRANVSADFLELMKQEIIEVIKKYIDVDESAIDVRLTNKDNGDGTKGAPALYANIPIINIKDEVRQNSKTNTQNDSEKLSEDTTNKEKSEKELQETTLTQEEKEDKATDDVQEITEETKKEENIKEGQEEQEEQVEKIATQNTKK